MGDMTSQIIPYLRFCGVLFYFVLLCFGGCGGGGVG